MANSLITQTCLTITAFTIACNAQAVTLRLGDAIATSFDEEIYLPVYLNPEETDVYGYGFELEFDINLTPRYGIFPDNLSDAYVVDHDNSAGLGSSNPEAGRASVRADFDVDTDAQYIAGNTELLVGYYLFEPNDTMVSDNAYIIDFFDSMEYPPRYRDADNNWVTITNTQAGSLTLTDLTNYFIGPDQSDYAQPANWQDGVLPDLSIFAFIDNGSDTVNSSVAVNPGMLSLGTEQGGGSLSVIGQDVSVADALAVASFPTAGKVNEAMDLTGSLSVTETNSINNQSTDEDNIAMLIASPHIGELSLATVNATADVTFTDITTIALNEHVNIATATASVDSDLFDSAINLDGSLTVSDAESVVITGDLTASDFDRNNASMQGLTLDATSTINVSDISTLFQAYDLKLASSEGLCANQPFAETATLNNTASFAA